MANHSRRAEMARSLAPACRKVQRQLAVLEELPAVTVAALQAHLETCGNCKRIERVFQGFLTVLRDVPTPEPDDPCWERLTEVIMARIRAAAPTGSTHLQITNEAHERARSTQSPERPERRGIMNGVAVLLVIGCVVMPSLACADGWQGWRGSGGWGADSPYERCYDPTNMDTFSGEVTSIDTTVPMPGMTEGIVLLLTLETVSVPVHLGPAWYIERLDGRIDVGDWIDVKGSKAFAAGVPAVIAVAVRKGDRVLLLRDAAGVPVWTGWRRSR